MVDLWDMFIDERACSVLDLFLSQMNPAHNHILDFFVLYFNVITHLRLDIRSAHFLHAFE